MAKKINKKMNKNKVAVVKNENKAQSQTLMGLVIANKLAQTVTVKVDRAKMHPLYHKSYKQSKKYLVHDEIGVKVGDLVSIGQIRPMSKNKYFKVLKVVGQDIVAIVSEQLKADVDEAIAEVMPEEKVEEQAQEVGVDTKKEDKPKRQTKKGEAK